MKSRKTNVIHNRGFFAGALLLAASATSAHAAPLQFVNFSPATTGNGIFGGVVENSEIRFTNVSSDAGVTVDAIVTATVKNLTDFGSGPRGGFGDSGFIPNYTAGAAEPNNDLGFLFYGNRVNSTENGISLDFRFFDGTGSKAGTFSDSISVSELNFAIYDVDGEPSQSEYFRLDKADGLTSYRLGNTPQALTATDLGSQILFEGPGVNFPEDDASGAAVLTFNNTSGFTLDFGAVQTSGPRRNGVFTGFDGDLSFVNPNDFGGSVIVAPVPEIETYAMFIIGLTLLGMKVMRSRKQQDNDQSLSAVAA